MNSQQLPKTLRGQKHRVFGNIESIYKFHCNEFYPKLLDCGEDVEAIADLFTIYVSKDYFYAYIIYAINRKKSELSCNYHVHYWKVTVKKYSKKFSTDSNFKNFASVTANSKSMWRSTGNQQFSFTAHSTTASLSTSTQ